MQSPFVYADRNDPGQSMGAATTALRSEAALCSYIPPTLTENNITIRYISIVTTTLCDILCALDIDSFYESLKHWSDIAPNFQVAVAVSKRKGTVSPIDLDKRWFIGVESAQRTIKRTSQRAVRDFAFTSATRRLKHTMLIS